MRTTREHSIRDERRLAAGLPSADNRVRVV
jgi:hypothetical protein